MIVAMPSALAVTVRSVVACPARTVEAVAVATVVFVEITDTVVSAPAERPRIARRIGSNRPGRCDDGRGGRRLDSVRPAAGATGVSVQPATTGLDGHDRLPTREMRCRQSLSLQF